MSGRIMHCSALLEAGQGGIARVARMSARALIENGAQIDLLSFLDTRKVAIGGFAASRGRSDKRLFAALTHLYGLRASHALYDSVGIAKAHPRLLRLPYGLWMMGIESWEDMRPDHLACMRRADLVIGISDHTLARHQNAHGALRNARRCWLATEQDEPPETPAHFTGLPRVLIVARIDAAEGLKGHDALLDAWPTVVSAVPAARLSIVGEGSGLDALRARAGASAVAGAIDFFGHVGEDALAAHFAAAHVFAMPSRQEGFGIAYAESMRFGLPVVASSADAGAEVNVDGVTGYTVAPGDRGALAEALVHLLRDPALCAALGAAGFARWRTHFRYACFAERFLGIWREFAGEAQR